MAVAPPQPVFDPGKLRTRRLDLGLRQDELAAKTGISQSHISLVESGHRRPSLDTLERFAGALGCKVGDFALAGEPTP